MLRILTDRGSEYCGRAETHDYLLYLAINDIEHTKTKVKSPQTNGICERFHKTILQAFYQVALRKNLYVDLVSLQRDLDNWLDEYNNLRAKCAEAPPHSHIDRWQTGLEREKILG